MSIEAMKQALEALDLIDKDIAWQYKSPTRKFCNQAAHFLRQAIEQAEKQEPVAWRFQSVVGGWAYGKEPPIKSKYAVEPLYTAPVHASDISAERVDETAKHRHEWVGLTFTEYMEAIKGKEDIEDCWQAIEAKLKEKNA
jgi:hypothetical protein